MQTPRQATVGTGVQRRNIEIENGSTVAGRFRMRKAIGRGVNGEVFEAEDLENEKKRVALKLFQTQTISAGSHSRRDLGESRFLREMQLLGTIEHPNIIKILDAGRDGTYLYMAMELAENGDLGRELNGSPVDPESVVSIAQSIFGALAVVHQRGIIHRDIKPENILRMPEGRVVLTDSGVARLEESATLTYDGQFVGSAGFMAPEQIESAHEVGPEADVFAGDAVLYELATGLHPFRVDTVKETLSRTIRHKPTPPQKINSDLPQWLSDFILELLEKEAQKRPHNGNDALERLRRFQSDSSRSRLYRLIQPRFLDRPIIDSPTPVLARSLSVHFGRKKVLHEINLRIDRGEQWCLLGRNGSGKTTLIRLIAGVYSPSQGELEILGTRNHGAQLHQHLGYVPETPNAPRHLTVASFLSYLSSWFHSWDKEWVLELLRRTGLPLDLKIGTMSRGQQTMVSVIAVVGSRPPLLLMDDPTLGLDAVWVDVFIDLLSEIRASGDSTLVLTMSTPVSFWTQSPVWI